MKKTYKKISVVLFTAVIFIVFLELGLRLLGVFYIKEFSGNEVDSVRFDNSSYTILCAGDSYTLGVGAPKERGYPNQLKEKIDRLNLKRKIQIVNIGRPSYNTFSVLKDIKKLVNQKRKPEMIIFMAGNNNYWNYRGFDLFIENSSLIKSVINNLRVVRFIKVSSRFLKKKIYRGKNIRNKLIKRRNYDFDFKNAGKKVNSLMNSRQYEKAIKYANNVFEETGNPDFLEFMGNSYAALDDRENAIKYLKIFAQSKPGLKSFKSLAAVYYNFAKKGVGDYEDAYDFFSRMARIYDEAIVYKIIYRGKGDFVKKIDSWIKHDIKKAAELSEKLDIKFILSSYPHKDRVYRIIKEIADEKGFLFADNQKVFSNYLDNPKNNFEDYFVGDGHCNEKGYGIVADNILNVIRSNIDEF